MKQLWTTLADRRRAGPPAFRRKYSQLPNATLSLPSRWPSLFERILAFEEGVGAHSEPCTCSCPYVTRFNALKPRSQKNNPTIFLKLGMRVYIDKRLGLIGGDFSRTGLGVEIDAKNTFWKRPKIVIFEENRQYLLNGCR